METIKLNEFILNVVTDSTINIFNTYGINISLKNQEIVDKKNFTGPYYVYVSMPVSGSLKGRFYLCFSEAFSIKIANNIIGEKLEFFDNELVVSAIEEIINQIIGNTTSFFENEKISINIDVPDIMWANELEIRLPEIEKIIQLHFSVKDYNEEFSLLIAVKINR